MLLANGGSGCSGCVVATACENEHERIFVKRPTASITVTGDPKLQVRAATLAEATPEVYRPHRDPAKPVD